MEEKAKHQDDLMFELLSGLGAAAAAFLMEVDPSQRPDLAGPTP